MFLLKRDALRCSSLKRDGCIWPSPTKSVFKSLWGYFEMCVILKTAASADYCGF